MTTPADHERGAGLVFRKNRWRLTGAERQRRSLEAAAAEAAHQEAVAAEAARMAELRAGVEEDRRRKAVARQKRRDTHGRLRAAALGALVNDFPLEDWELVMRAWGARCAYCGQDELQAGTLGRDHVIPLSEGGAHTLSNIVPACASCNSRKGAGPAPAFAIQPSSELRR